MRRSPSYTFSALLLLLFASNQEPHPSKTAQAQHTPIPPGYEALKRGGGSNSRALTDEAPPPLSLNNSTLGPPDAYLRVPNLYVGHMGLDVDNLKADVSLSAQVANIVSVRAGISVGIDKVNISIDDVGARLDLVIRLGSLVQIVNRTMQSLDLNPALINAVNHVGNVATGAVGATGGLVGTVLGKSASGGEITVDNKGNIVEEVKAQDGKVRREVVGNYKTNMVDTGQQKNLGGGQVEKTFEYKEAGALVNIVFDSGGQVMRTKVVRADPMQKGTDGLG